MTYDPYRPPHRRRAAILPSVVGGHVYGAPRPRAPEFPPTERLVVVPRVVERIRMPEPAVQAHWPYAVLAVALLFLACATWTLYRRNLVALESATTTTVPEQSVVACARVFRAGQVIDERGFDGTCRTPAGTVQFVASLDCVDGRTLYQLDAASGAKPGYGWSGAKFRAVRGAFTTDPGYARAVRSCIG